MRPSLLRFCALLPFCAAVSAALRAEVTLPAIWSDHAVVKRDAACRLWGNARPGANVRAALAGAEGRAVADAAGKWELRLDLSQTAAGPHELVIDDGDRVTLRDILVGDVWVCSGQSNMEWALQATSEAAADLARSANPSLRLFLIPKRNSAVPLEDCGGRWVVAGPETAGSFPAVGYFFGRRMQAALGHPVGLIGSSWSGTRIEPWIPPDAVVQNRDLEQGNAALLARERTYPARFAAYSAAYRDWQNRFGRADHPYSATDFTTVQPGASGWTPVSLPGNLASRGFSRPGATWFRRQFRVPKVGLPGIENGAILYLPPVHGFDTVYWNGAEVGRTWFPSHAPEGTRRYVIPRQLFHENELITLAIRVFSPGEGPRFADRPSNFAVGTNIFDPGELRLEGPWEAKTEYSFPPADGAESTYPRAPMPAESPIGRIYNALINPLTRYLITGVVWYQGESNVDRAVQYRDDLPLLIESWRRHWKEGPFPFYWCQIANHGAKTPNPGESAWGELREAQHRALRLPHTGEAVLIDLGVASDEHPRNKAEVGERLARVALAQTFGWKIPYSGPVVESVRNEGRSIRIAFAHADGGLAAGRPGAPAPELQGFAICGADRKWTWATARIEGDNVVVESPRVPKPVAVRYAWAENPTCNLYNGAGLPASPFRTDDFPATTQKNRFGL